MSALFTQLNYSYVTSISYRYKDDDATHMHKSGQTDSRKIPARCEGQLIKGAQMFPRTAGAVFSNVCKRFVGVYNKFKILYICERQYIFTI